MKDSISITAISSISPLGFTPEKIWNAYKNNNHNISQRHYDNSSDFVAELNAEAKAQINLLREENSKYRALDNSVLYALFASRQATKKANWNAEDTFGINIGSSRGATGLFEDFHAEFLNTKKTQTLSSPTTTLGNISSWVAHDLKTKGPDISHSITCSTALHSMLNGIAWINSGMTTKFLVGGSEAPLTPFTIAQMKALKIYSHLRTEALEVPFETYPCQSLNLNKTKNTMVLGEAASIACLEAGNVESALAKITGFGYATELLKHNVSLSSDAECFQRSMQMALNGKDPSEIDIIVTHTPGTIKGDLAEFRAIETVFSSEIPTLTTNKWKVGHSLGASGMLSIELAILMLQHQQFIPVPFVNGKQPNHIQNIMVNAVGFGGNAVSIVLTI